MESKLELQILPQPDEFTCGPTCLHAIYAFYGDLVSLDQVIDEVGKLEEGGTLAVFLGCHALHRGYDVTIFTYNLQVFDPTWFHSETTVKLRKSLQAQKEFKSSPKLHKATEAYLEYLNLGGRIRFEDLTKQLVRKYLNRSIPILTGLSATYLYRSAREYGPEDEHDSIRGEPSGHFVVLSGYDATEKNVLVCDPYLPNPVSGTNQYLVSMDRVICAILLGIVTYDANLLIVTPKGYAAKMKHAQITASS
jgi:hypothetical protein